MEFLFSVAGGVIDKMKRKNKSFKDVGFCLNSMTPMIQL